MKRSKIPALFSLAVTLAGFLLVLYPLAGVWLNSAHQSKAVVDYVNQASGLSAEGYNTLLNDAHRYNESLAQRPNKFELNDEQAVLYPTLLQVEDSPVMGYVEIPSLRLSVPICHGTDNEGLKSMVGHLEWTSLPVGGQNTHSVIAGHRGLPSAKLFSDLDELQEKDTFIIRVLNETLTYEVDQIKVVNPDEGDDLVIEPGKDLCTLLTCTPYGVNTHRLLVRGHRIPNQDQSLVAIFTEAIQVEPLIIAPLVGVPLFLLLLLVVHGRSTRTQDWEHFVHSTEGDVQDLCAVENEVDKIGQECHKSK